MTRRLRLLVVAGVVVLGASSEWVAFGWDEPRRWLPDLAVGWVFIACGVLAWSRLRKRGTGALMVATGVAWFAGGFAPALLYLHRGPLVHLLLGYPDGRPPTRLDRVAIGVGYAAALAWPLWRSDRATIVFVVALVAAVAHGSLRSGGRLRRERMLALEGAGALAAALAGGAAARLVFPAGDAADPALLVYEIVLCAIALGLLAGLRERPAAAVADLVVELGLSRSGTLRDALARALGDPALEVGYWTAGAYVDVDGWRVELKPTPARSATFVERDGRPLAVLVHDPTLATDPALMDAMAAAARLTASNASLQAGVRAQVAELAASSRRLLAAAEQERRRLETRLHDGPERILGGLATTLERALPDAALEARAHLERAARQLAVVRDELGELARGLHPRELSDGGLGSALRALAARSPVPIDLAVIQQRFPPEVEAACYFVCAEALVNVAKYASATRVAVEVARRDGRVQLSIADDGVGGADAAQGSGLRGLRDRVEALGGSLRVDSPPGAGTRLTAELPLVGER